MSTPPARVAAPVPAVPDPGDPPPSVPTPADLIAAAVLGCPHVARLHGGRFGEVATYLPGRRVSGVRIRPAAVDVHLVGRYPAPVPDLDAAVRAAVAPHLDGRALSVVVEDYTQENL